MGRFFSSSTYSANLSCASADEPRSSGGVFRDDHPVYSKDRSRLSCFTADKPKLAFIVGDGPGIKVGAETRQLGHELNLRPGQRLSVYQNHSLDFCQLGQRFAAATRNGQEEAHGEAHDNLPSAHR
jgi:hypothetical protein